MYNSRNVVTLDEANLARLRAIAERAKNNQGNESPCLHYEASKSRIMRSIKVTGNTLLLLMYVVLGGMVFCYLEHEKDLEKKRFSRKQLQIVLAEFAKANPKITQEHLTDLVNVLSQTCQSTADFCGLSNSGQRALFSHKASHWNLTEPSSEQVASEWSYRSGMYVAFTTITTIGYGNLAPTTIYGRIFCIFYALVGIPMFFWILRMYGDSFCRMTAFIQRFSFSITFQQERRSELFHSWLLRTLYYIVFILLFICLPTIFYHFVSGWTWTDSIYFVTVTLTTVGFGDIVPESLYKDNSLQGWVLFVFHFFVLMIGLSFVIQSIDNIGKAEEELQKVLTKRLKRSIAKRMSPSMDVSFSDEEEFLRRSRKPSNASSSEHPSPAFNRMTINKDCKVDYLQVPQFRPMHYSSSSGEHITESTKSSTTALFQPDSDSKY